MLLNWTIIEKLLSLIFVEVFFLTPAIVLEKVAPSKKKKKKKKSPNYN